MKTWRIDGKLFSILTSKLFALTLAFTLTLLYGWEAGAATMLIGLNTDDNGGDGGDGTALGGDGDGGGDGGGGDGGGGDAGGDAGGSASWTEGLPDEVKAFFGEAKSLDEFKASLPKAAEVPEDYAYTVPEGTEGIDQEVVAGFSAYAKENGLQISQSDFEKLMVFDQQRMANLPNVILEQANNQMLEGLDAYKTEVGEEKFGEHIQDAKKVIAAYGNQDFKKMLNETKIGNHPEMLKFMAWAAPMFKEDTFVAGDPTQHRSEKTPAQKLYPNQGKK